MEYKPRHSQPFTFEQALTFEPAVITAEIARLQNSLERLRETQRILQETIIASDPQRDPELVLALTENESVISSQEERISMLRMALEHKGVVNQANPHYDLYQPANSVIQAMEADNNSEPEEGVFL